MLHSRIERVQKLLLAEVAAILDRDLRNPKLPPLITVHSLKLSKDLGSALVFFTIMGEHDEAEIEQATEELNHSAGYIRSLVAQRVKLKRHPRLKFRFTESTEYAAHLETLFHEIHRDEPPTAEIDADEPGTEPEDQPGDAPR